jgi:TolB-like protein
MSPEQLRAERLDFRSDIFSIGVVLYELISGKRPFARDSDAEVISAILTSQPVPLTHNSENVLPELARIVFKCLEKEQEHRYQSASELLYDLNSFQQDPVKSAQRHRFLGLRLAVVFALLMILVAAWSFMYRHWARSYTLAVLPINNESHDASLDYLEDGFAESLINQLSRLPKLRINAFTTVSGYRGSGIQPQQIGRDLGVDSVLMGRIIRQGDSLVLQTNLINTADGSEIWVERYDINQIAIPDLQEKVSEKIASNLELQLGAPEKKSLTARDTKNDEAFQEYLRGRFYWKNRNKDNIQKAIEKFKAAIELDPAFARAYAGLADCYVLMNTSTYGSMPTDEAMNRARAAAKQALEIDNTLPEAHTALGVINLKYDWDWQEAERQFKQAINLNPDYAPAHYWYSNLLTITGRQAEAVAESTIDKHLDPFSPSTRVNSCREFYYGRQYDKAAACFNEILKEDPQNVIAQHALGFVYEQQGMNEEAIRIFENLPDTNRVLKIVALGYSYGRAGRKAEALRVLAEAEEISKHTYIPPFEFAVIYLGLGDKEHVFVWLEKAYEDRFATLIYLTVDPAFDNIRADPRFGDLARRLNLPLT